MSGQRGVKTRKSAIPGVTITQFVENVPKGCSIPDFEKKPITLTLSEGKNAIFRAVVKGEPKPEMLWKCPSRKMDDPQKYQVASIPGTNEFTLQINKITANDAGVYRFTAVNDYGEATCTAGLKIIQVGFKKKAKEPAAAPQTDLKKEIQDFKKTLKKRTPTAAPKKEIDMEQVWQLLLNADKKDYEKICLKYGIVDFRGMLRTLQEMRKEREDKQAQYVYNIANLKHVKINQEQANASIDVEMELKNPESRIYLYKDGEMINFSLDSDNAKHCLRKVGKKYNFTINDLQPEDAGVYQIKIEDVDIFSTELEAENIPVYFRYPLGEARCHEQGNAVFQCTLYEPCFNAVWFHKQNQLKSNDKYEISVSNDGLSHRLVIKNAQPSDKGTYTIDIGRRTSSAWLEVESKGKRKQTEGDNDKARLQSKQLDEDDAKKLHLGEGHDNQDHLADTSVGKHGQYKKGNYGSAEMYSSLGADRSFRKEGRMGQFSAMEARMAGDYNSQRGLYGKDGVQEGAGTGEFGDLGGAAGLYGKEGMLGGFGGPGGTGGISGLYGKDGMPVGAGTGGPGDADGIGRLYGKDGMPGGAGVGGPGGVGDTGVLYGNDGMPVGAGVGGLGAEGIGSLHGKDGIPGGAGVGASGGAGDTGVLYVKDGMPVGVGVGGLGAEGIGGLYGKDGMPVGAGFGGPGSAGGIGGLYGKDGMPLRSGTGGPGGAGGIGVLYGKDGMPIGAEVGGPGDAGDTGVLYGKDGMPVGAGTGGPGDADGIGRLYGKDGMPGGAGVGGPGGAGDTGVLYVKDGMPVGAGVGGLGAEGIGELYGKDGMPVGTGTGVPGGAGGIGVLYGKDGMPIGAGIGGLGAEGIGGLYEKDGMPVGTGFGGPGSAVGIDGLYGKDGIPLGSGTDRSGSAGGIGKLYDMDGMPIGAGVSGLGAEGIGGLYGKDGMPAETGFGGPGSAGGIGGLYGKDGMPLGSGTGGTGDAGGISGLYNKDGMPIGAGVGRQGAEGIGGLCGKYGMPVETGFGGPGSAGGIGGLYRKYGMPVGAGVGGTGGAGGIGGLYGKDGMPLGAGTGGAGDAGGASGVYGKDGILGGVGGPSGPGALGGLHDKDGMIGAAGASGVHELYGKDGMPVGAGTGGPCGIGGNGGLYGKDGMPQGRGTGGARGIDGLYGKHGMLGAGSTAGPGGAGGAGGVDGKGGILVGVGDIEEGAGLYGKDGVGGSARGIGTGAGGPGVVGGVGGLYAKDGMLGGSGGAGGAGGVHGLYDKDGIPVVIGIERPDGMGAKDSLYGKDGMLAGARGVGGFYGKGSMPSGEGTAGLGGLHGIDGSGSPVGLSSLYGKDSMPVRAGTGGHSGTGEGGGLYGKDGLLIGTGNGGPARLGGKCGKDGAPGRAGSGDGLYGKDGILAGTGGVVGLGGIYGKDSMLDGTGAPGNAAGLAGNDSMLVGAGGAGGTAGLYGKGGMAGEAGTGRPDGTGDISGFYGKDGVLGGAGGPDTVGRLDGLHGREGVLGEVRAGGLHGKDGIVDEDGGAGGATGLYGKDGMPAGAGIGGPGGSGGGARLYGKDGMPVGSASGGLDGGGDIGGLYGRDGMPLGAGTGGPGGAGGIGGLYGKDSIPIGAGVGGPGAGGIGGLYDKDGMPVGAGSGGPGGAGGIGGLYGKDGIPIGAGVGGPGVGGIGGLYGKDGMPIGAGSGGPGVFYGMEDGSSTGEAGDLYRRDGMPVGAGTGGVGGVGSLYGKDGMLGGTGAFGEGGSLDNLYGRDGRLGGTGTGGSLHGQMSGVPGDDSLAYDQSSGLPDAGLYAGDRRRQLSDLDGSRHTSADTSRSRDRKGRGGNLLEEDIREPHCRFTQGLFDVHAQKGRPTVLSCSLNNDQLEGIWFKDGFKITGLDGVSIKKEGSVHKLIIDKVQDNHAGKYKFEAEGVRTEASIFVEDPPNVDSELLEKLKKEPIIIKAGKNAMVKIPFDGRKPIKATWLKDEGELLDDARISTDYSENYARLSISSANRKDCGDYKLKLKNKSGSTEATFKLVVTDKPQPPTGPIEVVDSSTSGITIQWKPPKDDGGKLIQSYIIERQQVGRKTWLTLGEINGDSTIFTTNKVEHDKSYYFRVRAVNAEGISEVLESDEVMAATKVFPGPPAAPKIVTANRGAVTLSWAVPHKTGNSRILGYTVEKSKKGSNTWIPVSDLPITERKYTVTDLKEGLQYEFRVAAINSAGTGEVSAPSEAVFARDPMKPPGPVRDLKVVNTDYCSISLLWMQPESEEESRAKGYIVEMRHSDVLKWTQCNALPIPMTAYIVRGLKAREMYFLRVRAVNDGGLGEPVELDTCVQTIPPIVRPKVLVKDTVKSFMIVKAGDTIRVRIPFQASPPPEVYWLKDGHILPAKATTATREGVSQLIIPGADFSDSGHYSIVLRSELGEKETFSFLVQVLDVPESPGPIQLVEKVPETVTLIWEPSPTEMRDRNLNYVVMRRDASKGSWHMVADLIYTNKCTVANFVPGREYFFRVLAKNYMGISEPSETVQPWCIHKQRGKFEVRLPKYKGINQKQPPRFLVLLKPHVVTMGFDCHMSCAVTGYPAPQVTWYKDGRNISKDPTFFSKNDLGVCSLVIPGVTASDAGQYMVVAINELGEATSKAELTIKEPIFY